MSTWAVVVAAGRGARAGLGENKVFHRFGGVSVLTRTLRALEGSGLFDGCVLVLALFVMCVNLLVDIAYKWIDPRVQLD